MDRKYHSIPFGDHNSGIQIGRGLVVFHRTLDESNVIFNHYIDKWLI